MSVIRVGFVFEVFDDRWTGGINYYLNLIRTVQQMPDSRIEIVIFTGNKVNLRGLEESTEVIRSSLFDKNSAARNFRKIIQRLIRKDLFLYGFLTLNKIDCLSHIETLWKGCKIPSLPWIADFQYKRLPEFFDREETEKKNSIFSSLLLPGNSILLSSYSAAKDLERYYPNAGVDVYVLQFVSSPPSNWEPRTKSQLQELYQLPDKWFHIPNQLWAHKNHRIVAQALGNLKNRGITPTVVSTGNTVDFRNPSYFSELTRQVEDLGLNKTFRFLGIIPYDDMLSLMYHSIAVINPSLFEGWSTTVEEAKSMGKKILLSDIDVHIEQSPKRSCYFNPHDSVKLAGLIEEAINDLDPENEDNQINLAKKEKSNRQKEFVKNYEDIIIKLTKKTRSLRSNLL
jgi:glycosyltransferase involved in cell wall biosynthesis